MTNISTPINVMQKYIYVVITYIIKRNHISK